MVTVRGEINFASLHESDRLLNLSCSEPTSAARVTEIREETLTHFHSSIGSHNNRIMIVKHSLIRAQQQQQKEVKAIHNSLVHGNGDVRLCAVFLPADLMPRRI